MQVTNIPIDSLSHREMTRKGETDFPLAVYHSVMSRNVLGYTPLHWHPEMQFCLVTRGRILFRVQKEEVPLSSGDGLFIGSGYLHMAEPVDDPDSAYICIDFMPSLVSSFPGSLVERKYVLPTLKDSSLIYVALHRETPWQEKILDLIAESSDCFEKKPDLWEYDLTLLISRMFLLLLQNEPHEVAEKTEKTGRRPRSNLVVQQILRYIARHYTEKITLKDLSEEVSYAQSECCRIFKKVTGETIFSYLRSYRLRQSRGLLSNSSMTVTEIAYACGFSSASYFIQYFHRQFGVTPLQYRRQSVQDAS